MNTSSAIAALFKDPHDFLLHNLVKIFGGATLHSKLRIFTIEKKEGVNITGPSTRDASRMKSRERWDIKVTPKQPGSGLAENEFEAYYLAMKQLDDDFQTTHFTVPLDGPDLLLTSQLSGCSFGFASTLDGNCMVSHIQPSKAGAVADSGKMASKILEGAMGGSVFGRSQYDEMATVLGHRQKGHWAFYAQMHNGQNSYKEVRLIGNM
jgi:hypothetical protein